MGKLYVAVSDRDGGYAGEDGGPAYGGKGRWRIGEVGEWTSDRTLPVAQRDPKTGLIWSGWLEEVEESHVENGAIKCDRSTKHYRKQETATHRRARVAAAQEKAVVIEEGFVDGQDDPSPEAVGVAVGGGKSVEEQLSGGKQKGKNGRKVQRPNNPIDAGIRRANPQGHAEIRDAVRPSDSPVE